MYGEQRTFLIKARNVAKHKSLNKDIDSITSFSIKITYIDDLSERVRTRVAEELAAQNLIEVIERKRESIKRFKLTELGLNALNDGLRQAGSSIQIDFQVNEELKEIIILLIETLKQTQIDNKEILMEFAQTLKDEANKENPRKGTIGTLMGIVLKGINVTSDISTIFSTAGMKVDDFIDFAKNIVR